ncbi:uncharacterized protein [Typha latifolia]|uniref:uncharacterized protein isoform X3 n=1 Tax=Typha latifolia TaxID=4733 RepID=UPI003C2D902F
MVEASRNDPSSSSSSGVVEEAKDSSLSGEEQPTKSEIEQTRQALFKLAMQGKWKEVVQLYKKKPWVQGEKLTRAEDTTLHVAISAGDEKTVLELLNVVDQQGVKLILEVKNDSGSTPLHLAAAFGMDIACWKMARRHPELVMTARNKYGETPIFTAVRHGKKTAFFALEYSMEVGNYEARDVTHCRREKDGNTILHHAIFGEYFELAYEIIALYPKLVDYVNIRGESPLHYLANKPLCFKSEIRFSFFDQVIYSCIIVEPLKRKFPDYKNYKSDTTQETTSYNPMLPETFDTFSHMFTLLKPLRVVATRSFNRIAKWIHRIRGVSDDKHAGDAEDPDVKKEQETIEDEKQDRKFPQIYDVGFALFKVVMKFLLIVLGIGLWRTQTLERKKRKNKYACHLMDKLLESCKEWEYEKEKGGMKPHGTTSATDPPGDEPSQELESTQSPSHGDSLSTSKNGISRTEALDKEEQRKNERACQLMDGLIKLCKEWENEKEKEKDNFKTESSDGKMKGENDHGGIDKDDQNQKASKQPDKDTIATPVLVATKNGITEMVKKILDTFPVAVLDVDKDEKNIVLLAVEFRQSHVYEYMLKRKTMRDSVFGKVDKNGNSALHLAARFNERLPWNIPGAVLQMQWEIKWYKYVMESLDIELFATYNNDGQTAQELFTETHKALVKDAGEWLLKTSESCSFVAALIAGVAFASAATVPGGLDPSSGDPILSGHISFQVFAFSSLVALCFSVTSLIMFLTILTSRYQEKDFGKSLPAQLIFGLTSLFTSIAAMLVSFSAGDFFIVEKKLKYAAFAIYGVMFLPVSFFAIAKFPLYVDLIRATAAIVPERTQKMEIF